jgi:hypothetical protein
LNFPDYFDERAYFKYAFTWIPRKCYNTKRWIWGKIVMGIRIITGPGEPVVEVRWYHKDEGIMLLLRKGN